LNQRGKDVVGLGMPLFLCGNTAMEGNARGCGREGKPWRDDSEIRRLERGQMRTGITHIAPFNEFITNTHLARKWEVWCAAQCDRYRCCKKGTRIGEAQRVEAGSTSTHSALPGGDIHCLTILLSWLLFPLNVFIACAQKLE